MFDLHLLVLILGVALICVGQYFAAQPFGRWFFGAGVFFGVLWVILVIASFLGASVRL